ncbi:MAG: ribonuclease P protein subunit [Promethearchaeota archaeon]
MTINPKYLIYHDLIGLCVDLKPKSKPNDSDFSDGGVVIDDTKNMLITQKNNVIKKYIKKDHIFRFKLEGSILEVNGSKIVGIPINRLRSLKKKKWLKK